MHESRFLRREVINQVKPSHCFGETCFKKKHKMRELGRNLKFESFEFYVLFFAHFRFKVKLHEDVYILVGENFVTADE